MVRPTINSEKHLHPRSLITVDNGTIQNLNIAVAVKAPSTSFEVREGAEVKAVWVEMWYLGSGSQPVIQTTVLEKISSGGPAMTQPDSTTLNDYLNKKNILYTTQGIVGDANSNPVPLLRDWYKIPKGKQRMGLGDKIVLNIASVAEAANDLEVCGMFIYKEYF